MQISYPTSPNFNTRGWDSAITALGHRNKQRFHPNGMRIDPNGRPSMVDAHGRKLSSPHRGVADVASLAPVVVTPAPVVVKVTPKVEPVVVKVDHKAQQDARRARLNALNMRDLQTLAKQGEIVGRSKFRKARLVDALITQTLLG